MFSKSFNYRDNSLKFNHLPLARMILRPKSDKNMSILIVSENWRPTNDDKHAMKIQLYV